MLYFKYSLILSTIPFYQPNYLLSPPNTEVPLRPDWGKVGAVCQEHAFKLLGAGLIGFYTGLYKATQGIFRFHRLGLVPPTIQAPGCEVAESSDSAFKITNSGSRNNNYQRCGPRFLVQDSENKPQTMSVSLSPLKFVRARVFQESALLTLILLLPSFRA